MMKRLYRFSRSEFKWAAIALFSVAPAVAHARNWWVIEPDGTCQSPHVYSSPADQIKTLTREGNSVQIKRADFPDGSFALALTFSGEKIFGSRANKRATLFLI